MFISAEKAGKEIRKIHGILYVYQCKKSRQRNNKKSWNFFYQCRKAGKETRTIPCIFLSVQEKQTKKQGKWMNVGKTNIFAVSRRTDVLVLNS